MHSQVRTARSWPTRSTRNPPKTSLVTTNISLLTATGPCPAFRTTNGSSPLWSVPASAINPSVVSGANTLVQARSGLLIIDAATGKIVAHAPRDFFAEEGNDLSVTNGLVANFLQFGEAEIIDLSR
jgi:hypothetical protein